MRILLLIMLFFFSSCMIFDFDDDDDNHYLPTAAEFNAEKQRAFDAERFRQHMQQVDADIERRREPLIPVVPPAPVVAPVINIPHLPPAYNAQHQPPPYNNQNLVLPPAPPPYINRAAARRGSAPF